jgi:hypothetical protein
MKTGPCKSHLQGLQRLTSTWRNLEEDNKTACSEAAGKIRVRVSHGAGNSVALSREFMVWDERLSVESLATVTAERD